MNIIEQVQTQIRHLERVIEDKQTEIVEKQSQINSFEYSCSDDEFNDMLDSCEGSVNVYGMEFQASDILKSCDPVAYRCAKADYESNYDLDDVEEYSDLKDELESLEDQLSALENELDELNEELESLEDDE